MVVAGIASSVVAGMSWAASARNAEVRADEITTSSVADTLDVSLQRAVDALATAASVVANEPGITNAAFGRWLTSLGPAGRFPGSFAFAYVESVSAGQLPSFARTVEADPPFGIRPTHGLVVTPAGARPPYCLMRLATLRPGPGTHLHLSAVSAAGNPFSTYLDPGNDECASDAAPLLQSAARRGSLQVGAFNQVLDQAARANPRARASAAAVFGGISPIELVDPVYAVTASGGRGRLLGWVGGLFDAGDLLAPILHLQPGMALTLAARAPGGGSMVVSSAGHARTGAFRRTVHLTAEGGWTLAVAVPPRGGWSPAAQGAIFLVGGVALTLLAGLLLEVLSRSRSRALTLVDTTTSELRHQASHDHLTGLPNRSLVLEHLEGALRRGRRAGGSVALLFVDLDGFKDINDTNGHGVGDELLSSVAERFAAVIGTAGTLGRTGGDEFVVLVEDASPPSARRLGEQILASLDDPFQVRSLPGSALAVSASIGVALGRSESPTELLRDADIALYQAKRRGRGQVAQFEPGMRDAVRDRVALDRELHDALTGGQFFLVYQPTFELGTLEVTGVEALLRWDHPDRGIVPPDEFIPALETSGLIVEVGRFVLDEACRQASRWHAGGLAISIAVNVSARQLEAGSLVADVGSALERSALDPHVLVLEVTESALMADVTRNAARLDRLKSLGIRVAVDDFGTGYSSLAYLQKFPVNILKIDRSFVNALGDSAQSAALVHAMVQLGDALGLETLAEGIEDEAQLQALRGEACRSGQGFWFSRPLRADDAEAFLRSRPLADMFVPTRAGRPPAAR